MMMAKIIAEDEPFERIVEPRDQALALCRDLWVGENDIELAQRIASQAWRMGQLAHLTSAPARFLRNTAFRLVPASLGQRQAEALYKLDF